MITRYLSMPVLSGGYAEQSTCVAFCCNRLNIYALMEKGEEYGKRYCSTALCRAYQKKIFLTIYRLHYGHRKEGSSA
jgi:hypothetical protein